MQHEDPSDSFEVPLSTSISSKRKKKEVICHYHAVIQRSLGEIECCMQREDAGAGSDALLALRRAQDAVELALVAGQAMEDRMREYRTAIESLGFIRNRKNTRYRKI